MSEADIDPLRYRPPVSDAGRVMDSLAALHLKVDALTRTISQLLRSLAEEEGEQPPARSLDGSLAGGERDQSQSLG